MQPKFPAGRALLTSLVLALIAAAGVGVAGRMTMPAVFEDSGVAPAEVATTGAVRTVGEPSAAGGDTTAALGDTAAAAMVVAEADSALAGADSALAAAAADAPLPPPAAPSVWPTSFDDIVGAPDRWVVVAAFALTFVASLITAALAVAGSAPKLIDEGPVRRRSDAVQLLAVLQREGRLVDFLQEDIEAYADAQIGAAARAVHSGCRQALAECMEMEPVMDQEEGAAVTVAKGFDPSAVRLTGNVAGDPPFEGAVRHRGWRASKIELPTDARGQDPDIVTPAEIEVS